MPDSTRADPGDVSTKPSRWADALGVLREVWGHEDFREPQRAPLAAALDGRDVLAILPTGGGKSLLYQIPALLDDGVTLVVSPLVALMQDQVAALRSRGVAAAALDASVPRRDAEQVLLRARFGKLKLLYVAPERLSSELFAAALPDLPVVRLAVDEAHCVSAWGRHFRPAYLGLADLRTRLEAHRGAFVPLTAVTATAGADVRADLLALLGLRDPAVFVGPTERPNLRYEVREVSGRLNALDAALRDRGEGDVPGKAIVYAATRRSVDEIAGALRAKGHAAVAYHAGMTPETRRAAMAAWASGRAPVVVATNAFGMGVDQPDVRLVAHAELPASMDAFVQESGRAGRDGRPAASLLLWSERDAETQRALIAHSHPTAAHVATVFDALLNLAQVPMGDVPEAPITIHPDRVARLTSLPEPLVRAVLDVLERAEVIRLLRRQLGGAVSQVDTTGLRAFAEGQGSRLASFVAGLLRALPAEAASESVPVALVPLARRLRLSPERVSAGLAFLAERGLLAWTSDDPDDGVVTAEVLVPRTTRLRVDDRLTVQARTAAERGLERILSHVRRHSV